MLFFKTVKSHTDTHPRAAQTPRSLNFSIFEAACIHKNVCFLFFLFSRPLLVTTQHWFSCGFISKATREGNGVSSTAYEDTCDARSGTYPSFLVKSCI